MRRGEQAGNEKHGRKCQKKNEIQKVCVGKHLTIITNCRYSIFDISKFVISFQLYSNDFLLIRYNKFFQHIFFRLIKKEAIITYPSI